MECDRCKREFRSGNTNGLPNGVGFEMQDGTIIRLCQECLVELGSLDDRGKELFFKDLGI